MSQFMIFYRLDSDIKFKKGDYILSRVRSDFSRTFGLSTFVRFINLFSYCYLYELKIDMEDAYDPEKNTSSDQFITNHSAYHGIAMCTSFCRWSNGYDFAWRVRQFGACQIVWWESTPGKGVAPSRYTALEPKPRGEV